MRGGGGGTPVAVGQCFFTPSSSTPSAPRFCPTSGPQKRVRSRLSVMIKTRIPTGSFACVSNCHGLRVLHDFANGRRRAAGHYVHTIRRIASCTSHPDRSASIALPAEKTCNSEPCLALIQPSSHQPANLGKTKKHTWSCAGSLAALSTMFASSWGASCQLWPR